MVQTLIQPLFLSLGSASQEEDNVVDREFDYVIKCGAIKDKSKLK